MKIYGFKGQTWQSLRWYKTVAYGSQAPPEQYLQRPIFKDVILILRGYGLKDYTTHTEQFILLQ